MRRNKRHEAQVDVGDTIKNLREDTKEALLKDYEQTKEDIKAASERVKEHMPPNEK
jgi:hypothetical protein